MDKQHSEHSQTEHKTDEKKDDFSLDVKSIGKKITSLFSSDTVSEKKEHLPTQHQTHQPTTHQTHHGTKSDETVDVKNLWTKHARWIIPLFLILLAFGLSTFFRMQTSELPITDEWARQTVHNMYRNQIQTQVAAQYPNLPPQNLNSLVDQEFSKAIEQNKDRVEQDIQFLSEQYRSQYQDEKGDTYLLEIDPYLWYSEARNYLAHGHLGDEIKDGVSYFSLRDGRIDKKVSVQLNPYLGAYLYQFLHLFDRDISLMRAMFLLPVLLIGLSLIPAFFIGRKIAGNVGGFFAATILAINGALLVRTPAGFSDTDSFNILFPLLAVWLFIESYSTQKRTYRIALAALTGLTIAVHSAAWTGWWYSFLFIIAAIALESAIWFATHRNQRNLFKENIIQRATILGTIILTTGIFVTLFQNFTLFIRAFVRPIQFITLKEVGIKSIWPNVLTTVAEFNTVSFDSIINSLGGKFFFALAIFGICTVIWHAFKQHKAERHFAITAIVILIWFAGTTYASTKGVRFGILMAPAFALAVGFAMGFIYTWVRNWLEKEMHLPKIASIVIVSVMLLLTLISPLSTAYDLSRSLTPNINDTWVNLLTKIKNEGPSAIITSWWDFGHWFYSISERMVTFDGGDQGERIHWVGKALLTSNQAESVGILRMLNCAQETAPHKLDEYTQDSLKSISIINKVVLIKDRNLAIKKYQEFGLTLEQAQDMLTYTHCEDLIPNYLITSQDMIGKSGVWGHFGAWDFSRATIYQNVKKLETKEQAIQYMNNSFKMSLEQAQKNYQEIQSTSGDRWIAPWPSYISGPNGCARPNNDTLRCPINLQGQRATVHVNLTTMNATIIEAPGLVPNSIVYPTSTDILEKELTGNKAGFSVVLIPSGEQYAALLADPLQANSMFTRLFFFEGKGLYCFDKYDDGRQIDGQRILTWKVDWECQNEALKKEASSNRT
ncbi:hypothetical protein HYV86_04425 [Candidatus Woesearchaeota archaeon]|nr:hypothetical protein [Candidatus Woesearchaeota archaeon]